MIKISIRLAFCLIFTLLVANFSFAGIGSTLGTSIGEDIGGNLGDDLSDSVGGDTNSADGGSTLSIDSDTCDEEVFNAQAHIREDVKADLYEYVDGGMKPIEYSIEDFSCLEDIWSDFQSLWSTLSGLSLDSLIDEGIDFLTSLVCNIVDEVVDTVVDMSEQAMQDAADALVEPIYDSFNTVMDEIKDNVSLLEDVTSGELMLGEADSAIDDQLHEAKKEYKDVLYN